MTENNELTTVPSWLGAQCSGVSNPAGPTFVAIMVVLDGKASIELLSSGVLVTRTGIGVGADDDSEDNCVAQLPLEVRFVKKIGSKPTPRVCGQIRMKKSTLPKTVLLVLAVFERREELLKDVFWS
jgi:hypothetical protein